MTEVPTRARPFVLLICGLGLVCIATGTVPWQSSRSLLFPSYLVLTALASALKTVMPGLEGTVSVNFVFFLVGVCNMTLSETLGLALIATVVQCFWRMQKRLHFVHFAFNLSQVAVAITAAYWTYGFLFHHFSHGRAPIPLLVATILYFFLNTIPVATVIALAENTAIAKKWTSGYGWTFPYYLIGAAIAGLIQFVTQIAGWEMSVLVLPAVFVIYRSYRMHLGRWEDQKQHLEEMAALNMRTIETLALAIEAKDHTTGDHLQRVRIYALELGKDLGLSPLEMEALRAASVLHDIGKLAVPEHIISKPGKLTPEEFEKMKVHPIVGAEIVEQVRFPYPVAAIVRSHHEKWDGSGYPDGLSGEAIPIGARILSAVDCLDALASDRQYRRALPLHEAMAHVVRDSGKAFDPKIVAALNARYIELEKLACSQQPEERPRLSIDVKVERGAAPDAGFEASSPATAKKAGKPAHSIASLGQESLSLDEMLSTAALRLRHLVPYDAIAVYIAMGDILTPRLALGENVRQLSQLRVRIGKGLTGWVAETGNPIVNGNPAVEPGFLSGAEQPGAMQSGMLRSALAVPLREKGDVVGVLALYHLQADAFTAEHLNAVEPACGQLALAIRHCLNRKDSDAAKKSAEPGNPFPGDNYAITSQPVRPQHLIPAK
jgi:putative nucleotidyltransferase with HDIG domain